MNIRDTIELPGGYSIETHYDENAENPRDDYDHLGTLWTWEHRVRSPDKSPGLDPSDFDGWAALDEELDARPGVRLVLPVYKYEHSGVAYSTKPYGCRFDSGRVGVIFAGGKEAEAMTEEQLRACLESEVAEYSAWAGGEVYGYIVRDPEGDNVGSCWGFIGEDALKDGIIEATSEAEYHRKSMLGGEQLVAESFAL